MVRDQRRLAAIVSVDVAGYSRLMGRDESGTVAALKALRRDVVDPQIAAYGGRIVKTTGDGLLLDFPSVVDAVRCVIEVQTAMATKMSDVPENRRIAFRIGVNLGDIIIDGDDIFGDGVNIAARLQEIAAPGGVCVSSRVHEDIRDRLDAAFSDGGAQTLKNIVRPIQVWRWSPGASTPTEVATVSSADTPLTLPDKPSIAVLPFLNMSGDTEQEYFTDGITEDLITELSRFNSLFVIARNSSFSYKGRSPDIRQVGRELGVRYVLEGSIRKSSNRIRVTGQLVDALTGNHIWAERYDRVLEDIFAVQEEVTQAIVAAIAPQIESTEQSKAARRRPDDLTAYEIGLLAWTHAWQGGARAMADRTLLDQAIREAREALTIDPRSVLALHTIAYACGTSRFLMTAMDREDALREGMWAAGRAIELDSTDALGYALRGWGVFVTGEFDRYPEGLADARRAHEMNPNDVYVLGVLAWLEAGVGEYERAIKHGHHILRLSPRDPRSYDTHHLLAFASFGAKQYAEGIGWASRALSDQPEMIQPHVTLTNCFVGANEIAKARAVFAAAQRLAPEYIKSRLEGTWMYARSEERRRANTFFRIAADLEDASAADALR
jgi:adenylate cyclase